MFVFCDQGEGELLLLHFYVNELSPREEYVMRDGDALNYIAVVTIAIYLHHHSHVNTASSIHKRNIHQTFVVIV